MGAADCDDTDADPGLSRPQTYFLDGDGDGYGTGWLAVSGETEHMCAIDEGGRLTCWGNDAYNQVSNAPTAPDFVDVDTGQWHSCALTTQGGIECWGGAYPYHYVVDDAPTQTGYVALETRGHYACAIQGATGTIDCWGSDYFGEVANAPSAGGFKALALGAKHACALGTAGDISCWETQAPIRQPHPQVRAGSD